MAQRLKVAEQWFDRTTVAPGLTLLTEPHVHEFFRCNIWHVRGRDGDLLVDSGMGVASLRSAAADLFEADVYAVATHAHMDHIGSLAEFDHRLVHGAEADILASGEWGLPLDIAAYSQATQDWFAAAGFTGNVLEAIPHADFVVDDHQLVPAAPTRVLAEGDEIDLGDRAYEVLHLPGHSPGSIGLFDRSAGVLFSGDAVYDGQLLDDLPESDLDDYHDTMVRLRELPVEVVHGGHGDTMTPSRFRAVIDQWLRLAT